MLAGAAAVQMGTAFLTTTESTASSAHKRYLLTPEGRRSIFTWAFSGRPARGIDNEFIELMEGQPFLSFPIQNTLTGPLRQNAIQDDQGEYQSLWCGSQFKECQSISVADLMSQIGASIKP
jgi:nitronate monooxygenase